MMDLFKRLRKSAEVVLIRVGLILVPRFPRALLICLARIAGTVAYAAARSSRRVGRANLDIVYGTDLSLSAKRRILRRSFQTFAVVVLDILWFTRHTRERLNRYIRFDEFGRHVLSQTPLICVTAHLGNWETMGQGIANAGFPLHSVAAPLGNPAADRLFIPSRELSGQKILSSEGVMWSLLRVLRENGRIGILLDQNTRPAEGGVFVPFFGLPAPISRSAAMLALRTRCNIGFGVAIPRFDGTYVVDIMRLMTAEEIAALCAEDDHSIAILSTEIARTLEQAIRSYPESWLWMYKRWKYVAPGISRDRYPYYAHELPPEEQAHAIVYAPQTQEPPHDHDHDVEPDAR